MKNFCVSNHRFPFVFDDIVLYDNHHDEYFCLFSGLVLMCEGVLLVDSSEYYSAVYDQEVNFFYNIFYGCGCFMVDNITILIVCISVIGVLSLFQGMETVLTTIVGGLIGFLAKDRVVNLETVNESDT